MDERYNRDPQIEIDGVTIDFRRKGSGRPILFLQALEGWIRDEEFSDALARDFEVLLPQHPGFGLSEFPAEFRNVGDLAQFYLTMLQELALEDTILIGSSFGGWIAAEMAVRCTARIGALVLVDAFGIRPSSDPRIRDIQDIYAMSQAEVASHFYHDPGANRRDVTQMPDHVLLSIARSRESMCFLGWQPYMHNPSLKRWLRRIDLPALVVWGDNDRVVTPDYGRVYAREIPGARFEAIPEAGHYPHIEKPAAFVDTVRRFVAAGRRTTGSN
jgi:pimeloyl-ACP methyl ester carboxylesterase